MTAPRSQARYCSACLAPADAAAVRCGCGAKRPADGWPGARLRGELIARRYRVVSLLGAGGAGLSYRAVDVFDPLDREVAVKELHRDRAQGLLRLRLAREAEILGRLSHRHIVAFRRHDAERGLLVTRFCPGGTLDDWLRSETGRLPLRTALTVLLQVAGALAHAHRQGVVHRDLKPANLLIDVRDGDRPWVRLADFGVAGLHDIVDESSDEATTSGQHTLAGGFVGTPEFAAPEQLMGERATPRSDCFALGLLLYRMVGGGLLRSRDRSDLVALGRRPLMRRPLAGPHGLCSGDPLAVAVDAMLDALLAPQPNMRPPMEAIAHHARSLLSRSAEESDEVPAFEWGLETDEVLSIGSVEVLSVETTRSVSEPAHSVEVQVDEDEPLSMQLKSHRAGPQGEAVRLRRRRRLSQQGPAAASRPQATAGPRPARSQPARPQPTRPQPARPQPARPRAPRRARPMSMEFGPRSHSVSAAGTDSGWNDGSWNGDAWNDDTSVERSWNETAPAPAPSDAGAWEEEPEAEDLRWRPRQKERWQQAALIVAAALLLALAGLQMMARMGPSRTVALRRTATATEPAPHR